MRVQASFVTMMVVAAGCAAGHAPPADPAVNVTPTLPTAADTASRPGQSAADVRFMHNMMAHHAQALIMAALVPTRTERRDFHLMAERIRLSQESEIAQMKRWLERRGQALPAPDAQQHAAMGHGALMPGMLSDAELKQLEAARGTEFERLFLELMIRHHEGALQMVKELYAQPGSGQDAELFMLASDVDADQTAEIRRMRSLLATVK